MLATYVHDRLTPYSFTEAAAAMRSALRGELGGEPSPACLALALAKCALETGRWRAIHQHNWGNIKAGEQYVGQYCCFELNEVLKGKVVWFGPRGRLDRKGGVVVAEPFDDPPGHPQTRMRANVNIFDGAHRYVDFMVRGATGRFFGAFNFMKVGNTAGMVHEMKLKGYMTADEAPYLAGVVSLQREFSGKLAGQNPSEVHHTEAEYEAFRTYRNEELLDAYVDQAYAGVQDDLNRGAAQHQREWDRRDTDVSELAPESEPYA